MSLHSLLPKKSQRGSLLLITLCFLVILSLMAFSAGYAVRQKLQVISRFDMRERLRLVGESGVQYAAAFMQNNMQFSASDYHSLNQPWANGEVVWKESKLGEHAYFSLIAQGDVNSKDSVYGLVDEGRKINLHTASPKVLQSLFEQVGVVGEDARRIVSAIRDWQDGDDDINDGGAETKDYRLGAVPYAAKNAPVDVLSELLWVHGVSHEIYDRVRPYLSLTAKAVNLNTAPRVVLLAMGLDPVVVDKILLFRAGKDGVVGTRDDGVFKSLDEVPEVLSRFIYLNETDQITIRNSVTRGFSVHSDFFTARVFAGLRSKSNYLKIEAVIDGKGRVYSWYEEFF